MNNPQPKSGLLAQALSWVTPNGFLAVFVILGLTTELTLLALAPSPIYSEDARVAWLGPCVLIWFWLTLGWVLYAAITTAQRLLARCPRSVALSLGGLFVLILTVLIFAYLGSWALYFRAGRFSNIETIFFAVENSQNGVLTRYLLGSESRLLWIVGFLVVALLITLPFLLRRVARSEWKSSPPGIRRFLTWGVLSVILLGIPYKNIYANNYERGLRKLKWLDTLKNRVNPVITLSASWVDYLTEESIEPCLDENKLKPLNPDWTPPPLQEGENPPSIVFVAIESLRPDVVHLTHQGREVTPHLNRLAKQGVEFTHAYSQSTHSDYADVCIVSSLYPLRTRMHHYYRRSDPWPRTLIYDVLKKWNYKTAIISSQNEAWGGMDKFLETPNLDFFYDAERSNVQTRFDTRDPGLAVAVQNGELRAGKLVDSHTGDVAVAWVADRVKKGERFFLSMNLQSSHFPYDMPEDVARPFQPGTIDFDASFLRYPKDKVDVVKNAYYNAIHHCDRQVGRLVEQLEKLNALENTIIVVMGENGEAFHENPDYVTHAREPVEPALRVACVMHFPKKLKLKVENYPVELIDMVPTTLGLLGWEKHPNFQGIDVLSSERPHADKRLLFFHAENGMSRADAVLLGGRWKLMHDRNSGSITLYDVKTDPGESKNLTETMPEKTRELIQALSTWRRRQLAYYHFPSYYRNFYPPQPPSGSPNRK